MEHHKRRLRWSLSRTCFQVVQQITLNDTRRISPCHCDGGAQAIQTIGLLGPHQRFQPGAIRLVRDIHRMQIKADPPHDTRMHQRQRRCCASAAREDRCIRRPWRQLRYPIVVAVAIGEQAQTGRRTHFEQRQRLRQSRQNRQKRGATAGFIGLRAACQHCRAYGWRIVAQHRAKRRPIAWRAAHVTQRCEQQVGLLLVAGQCCEKLKRGCIARDSKGASVVNGERPRASTSENRLKRVAICSLTASPDLGHMLRHSGCEAKLCAWSWRAPLPSCMPDAGRCATNAARSHWCRRWERCTPVIVRWYAKPRQVVRPSSPPSSSIRCSSARTRICRGIRAMRRAIWQHWRRQAVSSSGYRMSPRCTRPAMPQRSMWLDHRTSGKAPRGRDISGVSPRYVPSCSARCAPIAHISARRTGAIAGGASHGRRSASASGDHRRADGA